MSNETATKRQSLITVAGLPGLFATRTGGDTTSEVTPSYDGGNLQADQLAGPPTTSEVVVTRPYKPQRDRALRSKLIDKVGSWRTTVSDQDTDADLIPIGKPHTWPNALLTFVNAPESDAASADAKVLELHFATSRAV